MYSCLRYAKFITRLKFQDMVERYVHWNEDIGEWQLKCVAYTGNNMRKQLDNGDAEKENQVSKIVIFLFCRSCSFALE